MCTVTFIGRQHGYALGMNRDEQRARVPGLPPTAKIINGVRVLSPAEPGGGTWISVNENGTAFALVNWYSASTRVKGETVSRGEVVNATSAAESSRFAAAALNQLPLKRINPFRLVGIFPATKEIVEWRWDLKKITRLNHRWKNRQWISSGFDEPQARRIRSHIFQTALHQKSAGTLAWLRRLHRSHAPGRGAFSTCMHRADACTVSYSEIVVAHHQAAMGHHGGTPCHTRKWSVRQLPLKIRPRV
jgi:hypothetical protein